MEILQQPLTWAVVPTAEHVDEPSGGGHRAPGPGQGRCPQGSARQVLPGEDRGGWIQDEEVIEVAWEKDPSLRLP